MPDNEIVGTQRRIEEDEERDEGEPLYYTAV